MSLDELIRRTLDPVANRLRDELARQMSAAIDEIASEAARERDQAVAETRTSAWEDGREQGRFEGRQEAEAAAREQLDAAVAAARADADAERGATERIVDALRAIDRARTLTEVLDTLGDCAGREAARAAVFTVRGDSLHGWRVSGYPPAIDARTLVIPLSDAGALADAVRDGTTAVGGQAPSFAAAGSQFAGAAVTMSGQPVALVYAEQPRDSGAPAPAAAVEIFARHAARALEALTAIKAARALTDQRTPREPATASRASAAPADSDDDEAAARRYARLLVSEIRLYHEPAVTAGRRERDLAARLGGEIARARGLYEERVSAAVRQRADYFHDELVRTLANGDSTLLQVS